MAPRGMTGVALITGGASGIGAACCDSFIEKGVTRLVLADYNEALLLAHVEDLKARYPNVEVLPVVTNVADEASVKAMTAAAVQKFQRIDYAVNCAGVGGGGLTANLDLEAFDRVMNINCRGTLMCVKEELGVMMKQDPLPGAKPGRSQRGAIVSIASVLGLRSIPYTTAYNTSKHAVVGFTKTAAQEGAADLIRVNAVAPGVITTPMTTEPRAHERLKRITEVDKTPMGREGVPGEVADVIVFMCSEEASFVTGVCWAIDGGWCTY